MKKFKNPGCLIEILFGLILMGVGIVVKTEVFDIHPVWKQIFIIIIVGSLVYIKDWINPNKNFYSKLKKADKRKDKNKAIELLEEALNIEHISEEEKGFAIEKLAKLYSEMGEANKSFYYYNNAINIIKNELHHSKLSEDERMEKLGILSIYYYEIKNYVYAAYYADKTINVCLDTRKCKVSSNGLIHIIKTYMVNNQKQKAINCYETLLKRKKCKKNKEVERLLDLEKN